MTLAAQLALGEQETHILVRDGESGELFMLEWDCHRTLGWRWTDVIGPLKADDVLVGAGSVPARTFRVYRGLSANTNESLRLDEAADQVYVAEGDWHPLAVYRQSCPNDMIHYWRDRLLPNSPPDTN